MDCGLFILSLNSVVAVEVIVVVVVDDVDDVDDVDVTIVSIHQDVHFWNPYWRERRNDLQRMFG